MNIDSLRSNGNKFVDTLAARFAHQLRSNYAICWIVGTLMLIFSLYCRSTMVMAGDSSFYFVRAMQILTGQRYYDDFFEANFPLNFYIYTIPVMLSHASGLSYIASDTIFVTIIQLTSIIFCYKIIKRTSIYRDGMFYNLLMIALFFGHFLPIYTLPLNEFGTKTILFFSFILPYFFYVLCEIEEKPLALPYSTAIGIFAGLVVCLKPDYALFLILIEAYVIWQKRDFFYLFRPVNYAILIVNLLHLAWLIHYIPEYIFKTIPMIMVSYPKNSPNPIENFYVTAIHPQIFSLALMALFFIRANRSAITDLLLIAVVASTIIRGIHGVTSLDQSTMPVFFIGLAIAKMISDIGERRIHFKLYDIPIIITTSLIIIEVVVINFAQIEPIKSKIEQEFITLSQPLRSPDSIYGISGPNYVFSVVMHTGVLNDNKIGNLYLLTEVEENLIKHPHDAETPFLLKTKAYMINAYTEGITRHRPKYIFVEEDGLILKDRCLENTITYFSKHEPFRKAWKDYTFTKQIHKAGSPVMLVFVRKDSAL